MPIGLTAKISPKNDGFVGMVDADQVIGGVEGGVLPDNAMPDLTGDVTTIAGAVATTIAAGAVTYAKMQDVSATDKILGRASALAGDVEEIACTAFARSILDDANEATFKATVNLEIGTDVQAYHAALASIAGLIETNGGLPYGTADNAYAWLAAGATGKILIAKGAAAPEWTPYTLPATVPTVGKILRSDGTNLVGTTLTIPDTAAIGTILYASAANVISALTAGATGKILIAKGAAAPQWTPYTLPATVPTVGKILRSDGTNLVGTTLTIPDTAAIGTILYASAANVISALAAGGSGKLLMGAGAGAPIWTTPTFPNLATTTGAYLRADGTNFIQSTLILPNAATAFRLPVATATNTIGELAAVGATGEYLKGNTGAIPSWATLNQAAVAGLTTSDSPTFANASLGTGELTCGSINKATTGLTLEIGGTAIVSLYTTYVYTSQRLWVYDLATNDDGIYATYIESNMDVTSTGSYAQKGLYVLTYVNPSGDQTANNTGAVNGIESTAFVRENIGTLTTLRGLNILFGSYGPSAADVSGTIDTCTGILVTGYKRTSTTINTMYGLYVTGIQGTTSWDLYCADTSAKNYFAGPVGISVTPSTGNWLRIDKDQSLMTANVPMVYMGTSGTAASTKGAVLHLYSTRGTGTDDVDLFKVYTSTLADLFNVRATGNVSMGVAVLGTSSVKVFGIMGSTAPTTSPADTAQLWEADHHETAGRGTWFARDEQGWNYSIGENLWNFAKSVVIDRIRDLVTPANIIGLWLFDVCGSETTIQDRGDLNHDLTIAGVDRVAVAASTASPSVWGLAPTLQMSSTILFMHADDDHFSFGNGTTDSAFSVVAFYKVIDTTTSYVMAKADFLTGAGQREFRLYFDSSNILGFNCYDESTGAYIGRKYNADLSGDIGSFHMYAATKGTGTTSAACKVYRDGVQVDDTDSISGSYTAMENCNSPFGNFILPTAGGDITGTATGRGRWAVAMVAAEELSADTIARLYQLFKGYIGLNQN